MKKINVSAPGKLMLFGEHAVVYGYPCIVTAVNQRLKLSLTTADDQFLTINAPDVNVVDYKRPMSKLGRTAIPKGAQFVEIAVKNFHQKYRLKTGISITTYSDFGSTFGFGSSSASTVCVIKALSEMRGLKLTNKQLFDLSYKTVLDVQGIGSGFDVASAIYGGTIYFVNGGKKIEQLNIEPLPLVIGYSGVKADTVTLINKVKELSQFNPTLVGNTYKSIAIIVEKAKIALLKNDWEVLGGLMNENQKLLLQLGVSIEKLDAMIEAARNAGAFGAKLSGAGGGDCMLALSTQSEEQKVIRAIEEVGGENMHVLVHAQGVRVENKF